MRWDVRRFQPNLLIETAAGEAGLVETDWLGRTLRIGEVEIACAAPTPRGATPIQAQADLPKEPSVLRILISRTGAAELRQYPVGNVLHQLCDPRDVP